MNMIVKIGLFLSFIILVMTKTASSAPPVSVGSVSTYSLKGEAAVRLSGVIGLGDSCTLRLYGSSDDAVMRFRARSFLLELVDQPGSCSADTTKYLGQLVLVEGHFQGDTSELSLGTISSAVAYHMYGVVGSRNWRHQQSFDALGTVVSVADAQLDPGKYNDRTAVVLLGYLGKLDEDFGLAMYANSDSAGVAATVMGIVVGSFDLTLERGEETGAAMVGRPVLVSGYLQNRRNLTGRRLVLTDVSRLELLE